MTTNTLKWIATAVLIVGSFINALGYYPLGPIILICGGALWLAVSIIWREASLIVVNSVMIFAGMIPLLYVYFWK